MSRLKTMGTVGLCVAVLLVSSCAPESVEETSVASLSKETNGKTDASVEAMFVNFDFDGRVTFGSCYGVEKRVEEQLLYTMGQLNGIRGVGRLDTLELSDVESETTDQGCEVTYHARMLVAWALEHENKTTYELILPRDVRHTAVQQLFEHYGTSCASSGSHADSGSLWYYWRPERSTCTVGDDYVIRVPVTVSASAIHTTGKYPEYHKIWEDGALEVVAIFGKVNTGGDSSDAGVKGYNKFISKVMGLASSWDPTTEPALIPGNPGTDMPDVTIEATLPDGRTLKVVALLVDDIKSASSGFYDRYESLTASADLLSYNGHSGLGSNIRVLARKGKWKQGQYAIVFMNGCDSYAYVDSALADAHADVNPDDPEGTLYLDILMNAMPSYFNTMAESGLTLIKGLLDVESPRTYEQIFAGIDSHEMVIVSGEQDNVFTPGFGQAPAELEEGDVWGGMIEGGILDQSEEVFFSTPVVAPGTYRFTLSGTGDADLYIRVGETPSSTLFDCRPYAYGSDEVCEVELNVPTAIYGMVYGWMGDSEYELKGELIP